METRCSIHRVSLINDSCIVCDHGTPNCKITIINNLTYSQLPKYYFLGSIESPGKETRFGPATHDAIYPGRLAGETRRQHFIRLGKEITTLNMPIVTSTSTSFNARCSAASTEKAKEFEEDKEADIIEEDFTA
jgi:hypothetical protein